MNRARAWVIAAGLWDVQVHADIIQAIVRSHPCAVMRSSIPVSNVTAGGLTVRHVNRSVIPEERCAAAVSAVMISPPAQALRRPFAGTGRWSRVKNARRERSMDKVVQVSVSAAGHWDVPVLASSTPAPVPRSNIMSAVTGSLKKGSSARLER